MNVNTGIFNNVASNTMLNYGSSGITASINDNIQGNGNVQWITLTSTAQADNIVADYLIICAEDFFEPGKITASGRFNVLLTIGLHIIDLIHCIIKCRNHNIRWFRFLL